MPEYFLEKFFLLKFRENQINNVTADDLPPCIAKSAAALAIYEGQDHFILWGLSSTTYAIFVSVCKF